MFTNCHGAYPRKKRALRGRRLVVVDIENVVGGAVISSRQAACARALVKEVAGIDCRDHVVIGTSHRGMLATGLGWPGARLVVRSGEDGADLVLLEVLVGERVEERFDQVMLVSGDGIFSEAVASLGAAGLNVTVVAPVGRCSKRLRMAARRTVLFDQAAIGFGGAA